MKTGFFITLSCLWLATTLGLAQTSSLTVVEENGSRSTRLNLVFLSEGYTSSEMHLFATDVQTVVDFLFTKEPWLRYRSYFNIYRIQIASNESGTDNGEAGGQRDTYFQTGFVTPGIEQLNTMSSIGSSRAYSLLNKHVPEYDLPIILINDAKYGGSGGPIALVSTHQDSAGILEHEVGHSFAKLTDEYDFNYPGYPATEFPNATAKTLRSQIRWNVWIDPLTPLPTPEPDFENYDPDYPYDLTIGLFEGANYRDSGWYRPHENALMRSLFEEPGSVTREAFILTFYSKVSPVDGQSPAPNLTVSNQQMLTFQALTKTPTAGDPLSVRWLKNGVEISGSSGSTLQIPSTSLGNGRHVIKAVVRDDTPWVRRDPTRLVEDELVWNVVLSNQTDPTILQPMPASRVLPLQETFTADATATGSGPVTYEWLKDGKAFKPAVSTPQLSVPVSVLGSAGNYTVKLSSQGVTNMHTTALAVLNPNVPRVVVGKGRTAMLAFTASSNLPPVAWKFGTTPLSNGGRYAAATTKALQIKNVDVADSGDYFFSTGDYGPSPAVNLLVVTAKPDYTGQVVTLPAGIVGGTYDEPFPLPADPLKTPNTFAAALPAGLKMDARTGRITGVPTVASKDQVLGDEITFNVSNEFGRLPLKLRLLIKTLPAGVAGVFSGPIHANSTLGGATGGRLDLTVAGTGAYSGSAVIGGEVLPLKGVLQVSGPAATGASGSLTLKPKHLSAALQVPFTIDYAGDADAATATLSMPSQGFAWRNKWLPPENGDAFLGYHTFAFKVPDESQVPQGHGFGSVLVDASGKTTVMGRLADGEAFASVSHLGPAGEVLICQALYTTPAKGSFLAVLNLDTSPSGPVFHASSVARWLRPQDVRPTARVYAGGFGPLNLEVFGGLYVPPAKTAIPMELPTAAGAPLTNALMDFDDLLGEDPLPVNADVSLEIKAGGVAKVNMPNPKGVTFSLTPADGRFKGSYTTKDADPRAPVPPATSRPPISRKVDYQGIIVRREGTLYGHGFLLRDALPEADGSTTPTTSPRDAGALLLRNSNL